MRVLTDGIGTLDLSSAGPDHAVSINPLTADRIEVLRGPAALLFGSSAIGGVVNVIDARIPRRLPDGPVGDRRAGAIGSAANERSANVSINCPARRQASSLHADANISKTDDLRTGGYILSKPLRAEAAGKRRPRDPRARRSQGQAAQFRVAVRRKARSASAYVDGGLNIGVSVTRHTQKYQVPIRYSLDPEVEAEAPTIDQEQTRFDVRAEVPLTASSASSRARGGYADYHHDELEDTGEIGSSFFSKGGEGRIELVQSDPLGLGRDQRRPISEPQRADRRRGEIPARQPPEPDRPVHAAELRQAARCGSKAAPGSSSAA